MNGGRAAVSSTRQCARFGCSAAAAATYTFDATACIVWIDALIDAPAGAGKLCSRHARSLTPPRGWQLEDRRARATAGSEARTTLAAGRLGVEHEEELRDSLDAHSPLLARAFRSSGTV